MTIEIINPTGMQLDIIIANFPITLEPIDKVTWNIVVSDTHTDDVTDYLDNEDIEWRII